MTSLGLALALVRLLQAVGLVKAYIPVSLALTTTALGTLLPILREHDMLTGRFGGYLFAAGAVGELFPVLAISLFLSVNGSYESAVSIAAVATGAWLVSRLPALTEMRAVGRLVARSQADTTQSTLRWTLVLLIGPLFATAELGLDVILGAFLAGMTWRNSRRLDDAHHSKLLAKLDAIGYGFFIPVFFIVSGMQLNVHSIMHNPGRLLAFLALLLLIRGVPALVVHRRRLPTHQRFELMFLTATSLPLLVALTTIATEDGTMLPENAAALVGAGAVSVVLYPAVAIAIHRRFAPEDNAGVSRSVDG